MLSIIAAMALLGSVHLPIGPYPCNGTQQTTTYVNTTSGAKDLHGVYVWMGSDFKVVADLYVIVTRLSDGAIIAPVGWDHYTAPVAPSTLYFSFAPNAFRLEPGDGVLVQTGCSQAPGSAFISVTLLLTPN